MFHEPEIPLEDKIILGPIDKYIKYSKAVLVKVKYHLDRFPWKLTIHLLLIVFTTMQVLLTLQG